MRLTPNTTRDDRVLRETRWLAAFIVPFLVAAFIILFLLPDHTDTLFAWTIKPTMTPLLMGAGYIAGAYFFVRVYLAHQWHTVHIGFLPITAFTLFMATATFMHLDRFHHDNVTFYIWTVLYIITPILVPLAWYRNRATDPMTPAPGEALTSPLARRALAVIGVAQFLVALVLLLFPSLMISIWPWALTPLTAQVIGGWFALPAVVALGMALEPRWSAIRITLESQLIGLGLILVATLRAWGEFDPASALTPIFALTISLMVLALLTLYGTMTGLPMKLVSRLGNARSVRSH